MKEQLCQCDYLSSIGFHDWPVTDGCSVSASRVGFSNMSGKDNGSVRVAVRVRPFNSREITMNAKLIIGMDGPLTTIMNPETQKERPFTFDFSYWSHDSFRVDEDGECHAVDPKYATQRKVFNDLGQDVLDSAFEGYNSTLFAYGQTGAGKSYSMVGYGRNKGIIPMVCEEMFNLIAKTKDDGGKQYQVDVQMLEIYNEQIRDLLNPAVNKPGGLKVRSNGQVGVYVDGLTPVAVSDYADVQRRMDEGTENRTVASTKMNATSSRAHTVFTIRFTSMEKNEKGEMVVNRGASINLVDLAGSERAESTGATGDRLKEGCAINQSLSSLGNVISALADKSMGKKNVFVPYRNSQLTYLLQDALGGNSKTIMIAALSPADVNYEETLSTLQYADRAKKIKNKIVKVQSAADIIKALQAENEKLKKALEERGTPFGAAESAGLSAEQLEQMKAKYEAANREKLEEQMRQNELILQQMSKSWEEKLADAQRIKSSTLAEESGGMSAKTASTDLPHIVNLHEDPMLSELVMYVFKKGKTTIGRKTQDGHKPDITLSGLNIAKNHAMVTNENSTVTISPGENARTFVNGDLVTSPVALHHGDRVIVGNNFVFRFVDPTSEEKAQSVPTWQSAMDEFSEKQGLRLSQSLSGEMGKLEVEEAQRRQELESKLKEMEEKMAAEREQARTMFELQKKMLSNKGNLSPAEEAQLREMENLYQNKTKSLEDNLARKKEMAEKMLQDQMRRKRENKKIEDELATLIPLVNETNQMCEEMSKPVRFEARLAVKNNSTISMAESDDGNLKQIEVQIRVTSTDSSNYWTWSTVKFESRLYIMRDLYQSYLDLGPRDIPKKEDPFWDPPEALEIGKAYVYLKALSQLVEIESEFSIVDYKGEAQGALGVEIFPLNPDGSPADYLDLPEELLGKPAQFEIRIGSAKGIPQKLCNDVYVVYNFFDREFETDTCETRSTTEPKFDHRQIVSFPCVDERLLNYLLKDAATFEVKGFSAPQTDMDDEIKSTPAAAPAASGRKCDQCDESAASGECRDCDKMLCDGCWSLLHKSAKKACHVKFPLLITETETKVPASLCSQCDENNASAECKECEKVLCDGCWALLHKSAKRASHVKSPLGGFAPSPAATCTQCEENGAIAECKDCDKMLCEGCWSLLHKSAKKANHVKHQLS